MSTLPLIRPEPLRAYKNKVVSDQTGMNSPTPENGWTNSSSPDRDSPIVSSNSPTAARARFLGIKSSPSVEGSNSTLSSPGPRQSSYLSLASLSFARNSASGLLGFVPSSLTSADTGISLDDTRHYSSRTEDGRTMTSRRFTRSNFAILVSSVVLFLLGYASAK